MLVTVDARACRVVIEHVPRTHAPSFSKLIAFQIDHENDVFFRVINSFSDFIVQRARATSRTL